MTTAMALEYIPRRMQELGYGIDYNIRFRHYVLQPEESRIINADDHLFILIEPGDTVGVTSTFGVFDLAVTNVNELQYEHQGDIILNNYSGMREHVRFIQIIPKQKSDARK